MVLLFPTKGEDDYSEYDSEEHVEKDMWDILEIDCKIANVPKILPLFSLLLTRGGVIYVPTWQKICHSWETERDRCAIWYKSVDMLVSRVKLNKTLKTKVRAL